MPPHQARDVRKRVETPDAIDDAIHIPIGATLTAQSRCASTSRSDNGSARLPFTSITSFSNVSPTSVG